MAERVTGTRFQSYVPAETTMKEFSLRALLLGLVMCVILGAANAYLGLKAGMTIAATYPAAVIGMAVLKMMKGSLLEENIARTVGAIGESIAAGAVFTIPAFYIAGIWKHFDSRHYLEATIIMFVGSVLGILFVTVLRRVMVEDKELPFPESVAAAEIHKAGRTGGTGAKYLFSAMGLGGIIQALGQLNFFAAAWERFIKFTPLPMSLSTGSSNSTIQSGGGALITTPGVSPAYVGVGYIIGPRLAALNFSGGIIAWGLFVPLLLYFIGPTSLPASAPQSSWIALSYSVWLTLVRPIAIGGMLFSAGYTLYKMRKSLSVGLGRAIGDVRKAASGGRVEIRTERDMDFRYVGGGIILAGIATYFIYNFFANAAVAALTATLVMLVTGFFFAAVSGYLVGIIGSSNNPVSGLTISTLLIAALLMVVLGQTGITGVAAVLGVAAVVCVSAAVAGEMLQDLKVGHILGGTPWKMQVGDLLGVFAGSAVMFIPLMILNQGDINRGGTGFGGANLPAPQAGMMAALAQGIVGGHMAWPLVIVGMIMAFGFIISGVRSPMLVFVGMYLPFGTVSAIFVGGLIRGIVDLVVRRRKFN
ncbi:MAG: oligopeptide transporter, OPT family, partial [Bacteroidetes bacterium]|nr:oligopeptide transporter, OPT family [Bacteroidota bacterium]